MDFLEKYPFAFLTGSDKSGKPVATQIPLMAKSEGESIVLRGHFMRNTDHHRAFEQNPQVLAVFTGPHSHVSATWYKNPAVGSTWNYMSVHCHGKLRFLNDQELEEVMQALTLHFEDGNAKAPNIFNNLPEQYLRKMKKAIVAFEIPVESMDNVFKLSQDRDEESYTRIIEELRHQGGDAARIAEEMEKRKSQLFAP